MENAKIVSFTKRAIVLMIAILMLIQPLALVTAYASPAPTKYFDDAYYDYAGDNGEVSVDDSYDVYYDELVDTSIALANVPSMKNLLSLPNACAAVTGFSVVTFYDRYYPELIPDYEPGILASNGIYVYYPDRNLAATSAVFSSLHTLMGSSDGTTSAEFRNGLDDYAESVGRNATYQSMYSTSRTVNLTTLASAVDQNKVGVIMCSAYNFVSSIIPVTEENKVAIAKNNSTVGHMMMVYGYRVLEYYADGALFRTDTFLYVTSSYSSGIKGYILLNDDLDIDEAYVVTIA